MPDDMARPVPVIDEMPFEAKRRGIAYSFHLGDSSYKTSDHIFFTILHDDFDGLISITHRSSGITVMEVFEYLVANDYAEWRAIGPEDKELFGTNRLENLHHVKSY